MSAEPLIDAASGFFGKLPARGDFVTRRLAREFVGPWDQWLQDAMVASREQLGERWLDLYLTAPIWRFALSPGACGSAEVRGVLMPSVDSVGRLFPLTIALPAAERSGPALRAHAEEDWFHAAEELALSALADDCDFDAFDAAVAGLAPATPGILPAARPAGIPGEHVRPAGWHCPGGLGCFPQLVDAVLSRRFPAYSLWWTSGGPQVEPVLLVVAGLPPIGGFAALMDGCWPAHGWMDGASALASAGEASW